MFATFPLEKTAFSDSTSIRWTQAMKSYQSITVVKTLLDHRASPNLPGERGPALEKDSSLFAKDEVWNTPPPKN